MPLRSFDLPARDLGQDPYVLHVWGPAISHRKSEPGRYTPTVVLRGRVDSKNFLLLEAITVLGDSWLGYTADDKTARIHTRAALRCFFDDRCRCFGGGVFCDDMTKDPKTIIAHALKETSQCLPR